MRNEHATVLKEITDEIALMAVAGGGGTGQWETGAVGVWVGVMESLGYSCSLPGNFYGAGGLGVNSSGGYGCTSGFSGFGATSGANSAS